MRACSLLLIACVLLGSLCLAHGASRRPQPPALVSAAQLAEQQRALRDFFNLRLDGNGDGACDVFEYQSYVAGMDPEDVHSVPLATVMPRFRELDANSDSRITLEEMCIQLRLCAPTHLQAPKGQRNLFQRALQAEVTTPEQMHLAITHTYTDMLISWAQNSTDALFVQWDSVSRVSNGSYAHAAKADAKQYSVTADGMSYTSLPLLSAVMSPLAASTRYFYRVGNDVAGWSPEYSFYSFPDPDAKVVPGAVSKIMVVGDMGTVIPMGSTVTGWMIDELSANPGYNMSIHVGDLAYAGVSSHGEWEPTWDAWMSQMVPVSSRMPYITTVGNHERYYGYISFLHRFTMPYDPSSKLPSGDNFWFSFDFEGIHFTSFSTENSTAPGGEMYEWMEQDLAAAANKPTTKWIVLLCHRPLYSSDADQWSTHSPGSVFLQHLEPLMQKYGVDLVVTGHKHMYERTWPVLDGYVDNSTVRTFDAGVKWDEQPQVCKTTLRPDPTKPLAHVAQAKAPVFIVQGTAGAMQLETFVTPSPEWTAFRQQYVYGFGSLSVSTSASGCSSLLYQFKGNADRAVQDQMLLQKQL